MNPTEAAFIEAMAETPDDLGTRLVFGDWLMERGDPRGDYFRLHHEVTHGTPSTLAEKRYMKVVQRELARVGAGAFARDGLIERVERTFDELLDTSDRLFSLGPIHCVGLTQNHRFAELVRHESLRWTFGLELGSQRITAGEACALAASPFVQRLRRVHVGANAIGAVGAAGFAQLPMLEALDVSSTNLAGNIEWLLPAMPRLRTLAIANNGLQPDALARLLAAARELTALDVSNTMLGAEGARAIAGATHLDRLRILELDSTHIDDDGLHALVEAPHLARLEKLSLQRNLLGGASADTLQTTQRWPLLRHLDITGNVRITWPMWPVIMRRFRR